MRHGSGGNQGIAQLKAIGQGVSFQQAVFLKPEGDHAPLLLRP
jgi:hypothetical protein